jgi:hypothetical protein
MVVANQSLAYEYANGSTILTADILIWKLREGSSENWGQIIAPSGENQPVELLDVPFNWQAGFRVGLGYRFDQCAWDSLLAYTRYATQKTIHVSTNEGGIYSAYLANFYVNNANGASFGPNYHNAAIQWSFSFNTLDLEFGRSFNIDSILKLRPKMGVKSAIINQDINTDWQNPTVATNFRSATENLQNHFWGIGPYIGLDTTWFVYGNANQRIHLFGNVLGGLLSGHWRFKDNYENNALLSIDIYSDSIKTVASMTAGQFGIQWLGCLVGNEIRIRFGYEAQIWFNQVQYYSFNMGRLDNLMSLQGGLLDFNVHF